MNNEDLNDIEEMSVTLTLDDNSELECSVLAIFPVNDKQYIALLPTEQEDEEGEIYLYRYNALEGEEAELINIEEDDEFEAVSEAFDELMDEEEFDSLEDEDAKESEEE